MSECCGGRSVDGAVAAGKASADPLAWFGRMIPNCLAYATAAKAQGKPIVGIMCEYTPRELILAAGAVPVCLCGGSAKTIPPAEQHLPANLCPLIKSTFGYHITKTNPFMEMMDLIVAETTCDGKKKMFELMAEDRPMFVLELPQKSGQAENLWAWHGQILKLKAELEQRFGVTICDDRLRQAIAIMNRERRLRRDLAGLMRADCPPLTGRQLLQLKSNIAGIPVDLDQYEAALRQLRGSAGCPSLKNCVRVLLTGVPIVHGAERVLDIIESSGGLVVCMENCTGLKPILEDVDETAADPTLALAEKYYHLPCSVMTRNDARLASLKALAAEYRAECVVDLVWQACLTYDVEAGRVRRMVEGELKLLYLRIETDYSPSDSARIQTRVEAMFETVRVT